MTPRIKFRMVLNNKSPEITVNQRLRMFVQSLVVQGIVKSDSGFAESIGFKKQTVSLYLSDTKLSTDFLIAVGQKYPELSLYWLLLGEGTMLRRDGEGNELVKDYLQNSDNKSVISDEFDRLVRFYNFGMEEISRLWEENKRLHELLLERELENYKQSLG